MQFTAGLAQVDSVSGDVRANLQTHLEFVAQARGQGVGLLIFPELSLTGADLLGHMPQIALAVDDPAISELAAAADDMDVVVGFAEDAGNGNRYNTLLYLSGGEPVHAHRKVYLVSADPFNERRFFAEGRDVRTFPTRFGPTAIINCEDAWHLGPAYLAMLGGARLLITGAATPVGPPEQLPSEELWLTINRSYSILLELNHVFVNRAGTEGPMEFCGFSHAIGPRGEVLGEIAHRQPALLSVVLDTAAVLRQRHEVSYVRDERTSFTLRELRRVMDEGPLR